MNVASKITVLPPGGRRGGGGGTSEPSDWRDLLVRNREGMPTSCVHNIMLILERDKQLQDLFVLDEFANRVTLTRDPPWLGGNRDEFSDIDATELAGWIGHPKRYSLSAKADAILPCVEAMARRNTIHPVRSYLRALKWDGVARVDQMFVSLFGAADIPYTHHAAKCFMVSAVARILWLDPDVRHNGAQVDFMLVLEGDQGKGKTSAVRTLFGAQWYAESMESPTGKDFYQSLRGRWCVEIGEMDSFNKADVTKVKQAITSRFDTYRPSYGRTAKSFRRECVFIGTTNDHEYLRDPTGGRRFLPVRVTRVAIGDLQAQRDQLWAEAVTLFHAGFKWWELPEGAVEEQESRYAADSWEEVMRRWLEGKADEERYPPRLKPTGSNRPEWVTTTELLAYALRIEIGKHGRPEQMRVAACMKRLGWEHRRQQFSGDGRERRWIRKSERLDDAPF